MLFRSIDEPDDKDYPERQRVMANKYRANSMQEVLEDFFHQ